MIKYKGTTSNLLTELSLEFTNTVDLNKAEYTLMQFFQWIAQDLSTEKRVQLICSLPVHLKPFCTSRNYTHKTGTSFFPVHSHKKIVQSILMLLKKYMEAETFFLICSCLPEHATLKSSTLHEKVFLVA